MKKRYKNLNCKYTWCKQPLDDSQNEIIIRYISYKLIIENIFNYRVKFNYRN